MSITSQQRAEIFRYLDAFDFSGLFTDSTVGWDWPEASGRLRVPFEGDFLELETVAEKRGVKVLHVPSDAEGLIISSDQRKKLEKAVTPLAKEHLLIFTDAEKTQQVWLWTSRIPGKPVSHRELRWQKGKANELLLQKLSSIAFTLDEEEALDITGVVERLRDSLDRDKVTKKFYDQFKVQKDAFRKFIAGLTDGGLLDWYTSLMLNRLMFCYFLQRKGFLDGDENYLSARLARVREEVGQGQFHSFYRNFLRRLFHEGLGQPEGERDGALRSLIGSVPYLNGGIFEEHRIEREHPDLHIPDEAFEQVFAFLDRFEWHLDDRPIAKGDEINPEILGYVFEKYTNQKEMGAYYTKEDITDYIAKNCIIPFLLDAAGDKLGDAAWQLLCDDPNRYIYPAVGHGMFCDYATGRKFDSPLPLPDYIEKGIDTTKPDLRQRRARWNESASGGLGLPTEIWRETVARRQRCEELQRQLGAGEVRAVNDLITLNLNIRQFAQDVAENASPDLLLALFKAIRKVSVLDPTCGSGAFLFAALNILEPLYRASLDRMRVLLGDWDTRGEKHPIYRKEFGEILDQAARHPNENYFIFKSIIVHNLYGVDIMEEAVEICKLRLFLKLAAQLEPGQEIEPLPDIDFNIRAGNTLVGYASREEVRRSMTQFGDGQMRLGVEDELQSYTLFEEAAENVDKAFQLFQQMQDEFGMSAAEFREQKRILSERLRTLRDQLDRFLAADGEKKNLGSEAAFKLWRASFRPFHWFVEFHGILNDGGFDVIIGNPPYVETHKVSEYTTEAYKSEPSGNLYAMVSEQAIYLLRTDGRIGVILPLAAVSVSGSITFRNVWTEFASPIWHASFGFRPAKLFEGVNLRLTILLSQKAQRKEPEFVSSRYVLWNQEEREQLFQMLSFSPSLSMRDGRFLKADSSSAFVVYRRITSQAGNISRGIAKRGKFRVSYHRSPLYWIRAMDFEPYFKSATKERSVHHFRDLQFGEETFSKLAGALLNSSLFYFWFAATGNCRNLTTEDVVDLPLGTPAPAIVTKATKLFDRLMADYNAKSEITKRYNCEYQTFFPSRSKSTIDEIDEILARHYGFTEEELDFIINYDIKYRMGLSGGSAEDSEE